MKNPSEIFERMFEECDVDVEFTDCSVKQPKCAYCGKDLACMSCSYEPVDNKNYFCSKKCKIKYKEAKDA